MAKLVRLLLVCCVITLACMMFVHADTNTNNILMNDPSQLLDAAMPPPPQKHHQQSTQQLTAHAPTEEEMRAASKTEAAPVVPVPSTSTPSPAPPKDLAAAPAQPIIQSVPQPTTEPSLLAVGSTSTSTSTSTSSSSLSSSLSAELSTELEAETAAHLSVEEKALLHKNIVVPDLPKDFTQPPKYMTPQYSNNIKAPTKKQNNMQNAITSIVQKAKLNLRQLKDQHQWVESVNQMLIELGDKKDQVRVHIEKQVKKLKDLLHTKKRIENKQTQEKIKLRLRKTWSSLKKIRSQESHVKKQRYKMMLQKENVEQAIEHIMTSLAELTEVDRDPKIISRAAAVMIKNENYDPDVQEEKANNEVNDLTKPDRMFF